MITNNKFFGYHPLHKTQPSSSSSDAIPIAPRRGLRVAQQISPPSTKTDSRAKLVYEESRKEDCPLQVRNTIPEAILKSALLRATDLYPSLINFTIEKIKRSLGTWTQIAGGKDLHLRPEQTHIPIVFELNRQGHLFLPLKKEGKSLGSGAFRIAKQAIFVQEHQCNLIAHLTQEIDNHYALQNSNEEVAILEKLQSLKQKDPKIRGIIQFIGSVDYPPKDKKKVNFVSDDDDYDALPKIKESSSSSSEREIIIKRALAFKQYSTTLEKALYPVDEEIEETDVDVKLNDRNILKVMGSLFLGLSFLHQHLIFHSDLHLDNILLDLDAEGNIVEAVIADYGCAIDFTGREISLFKNGKREYRAPELQGMYPESEISAVQAFAADVYSLSIILNSLAQKMVTCPHELRSIIHKMHEIDPNMRYSAKEAAIAFFRLFSPSKK